jgi:hypothetical protein
MPMRTLLLNHVMEYTNPLLGLTSSRIATAPDPATSAEPSVSMPAKSSIPLAAPAPLSVDSIESQSQGKISNSSTPFQPGTLAAATSDSAQALRMPQLEGNFSKFSASATSKGGAKKAQKMRPSKTSTAR